ncbi:aldo/keto reductase [Salinispira pacifica]
MEYRTLGGSGLNVSALSFGTGTFGGDHPFFGKWGHTDATEASRFVGICMDHGVNLFDSADVYSSGQAEEILGQALKGHRNQVLISTKATFRFSDNPNDIGHSRHHLISAVENALRRLQTNWLDLFILHGFDAKTSVEETVKTLETLVQSGKVRAVGCSNYSGWHTMKTLAAQDRYGFSRLCVQQVHYSLLYRQIEWELMPLALDQNLGTMVWGPLSQGRLTGKIRPGQTTSEGRVAQGGAEGPEVPDSVFAGILEALETVAAEAQKSVAQVALAWLLTRPSVSTVVLGARKEAQLVDNLGSVGWSLSPEQIERIDRASETPPIYPYWHQRGFSERNPSPVPVYLP